MLSSIWNNILYKPLINALALFPFSQKSIESQAAMNSLAPHIKKIKESGVSKEEQARLTFELYKEHKTNPFSGCLLVLIQIPIIFALYYVFLKGINFESGLLYS